MTDAFIQHGYKGAALRQLNSCRLYLQVDTLSDITTADGCYLTWFAQHGQQDYSQPQYHWWPMQADPGEQVWNEWQCALAVIFCREYLQHGLYPPEHPFLLS